jgi:cbb3-type cytochrome oxidase subunit 3
MMGLLMKSSVLLHFPWIVLTCIGLLIFVGIYLGAIFRVYNPGNRQMYRAIETLPLEEGDGHV